LLTLSDSARSSIKRNVPGPGAYDPKTGLDAVGKYTLSTISNSKATTISPSKRFSILIQSKGPGPGAYDPKDYLDSSGNYFSAKYKSSGARKFGGTSSRERGSQNAAVKQNFPGPG
jgi:hypothetical protein